jgi:phosphoserine phosphatase
MSTTPTPDPIPLCVDLDGTLIAGDTLVISGWLLVRRKPWLLPLLAVWLASGKAVLKARVAQAVLPDCSALPYRADVVSYLESQRGTRRIILATAANERIARRVAEHLGLFDAVIASDGRNNLKGAAKLAAIRSRLGEGEFDYLGDSLDDLPVLAAARKAVLVYAKRGVGEKVRRTCVVEDFPAIVERGVTSLSE